MNLWRFSWPFYIFGPLLVATSQARATSPIMPRWSAWLTVVLAVQSALAPISSALRVLGNLVLFFAGPLVVLWLLALGVSLLWRPAAAQV